MIQLIQMTQKGGYMFLLKGKDPIYLQIKQQVIKYINNGVLKANDKLDSVRNIASELCINPNTVQRAYSELEIEGYIYTIPQKGSFVSENLIVDSIASNELITAINSLKNNGYSKKQLLEIINEVYDDSY